MSTIVDNNDISPSLEQIEKVGLLSLYHLLKWLSRYVLTAACSKPLSPIHASRGQQNTDSNTGHTKIPARVGSGRQSSAKSESKCALLWRLDVHYQN